MNNSNESSKKDNSKIPWAAMVALGMGMLVYGVAESFGPVVAILQIIPSNLAFLGYSLPFIAGGIGAFMAGILADYTGRRTSFMITMALLLIGLALFVINSHSVPILLLSFTLVGISAIGLESPILAMMAEQSSAKNRGTLLVITQNFGNLGVAIVFIPVVLGLTQLQDETAIALMFIGPIIALIISWLLVEESLPWSATKKKVNISVEEAWKAKDGNVENVKPTGGLGLRFLILILIGIAQDVAFVYITYGVGYAFFPSMESWIPLIGGFTMVIVGIVSALLVVPKINRKTFAVLSYALLVLLWIALWIYYDITKEKTGFILLAILTMLFIPVEITWGVRAILEPELFSTSRRGIYISIVRMVVWVSAGVITGILTAGIISFTFNAAMAITTFIFALGLLATILWQAKGFETKDKSLAGLDHE